MKEFVCIVCPNGCRLSVDGNPPIVTGNMCKRGEAFAISEITNPTRTICSTVRTAFSETPVLPVRVSKEIPKDRIFDVMKEINKVYLTTRVKSGEVIIKNVLNLGADIIATSNKLSK